MFRVTADYTEEYPSCDTMGNLDGLPDDEAEWPDTGRHRPDLVNGSNGIDDYVAALGKYEYEIIADDLMPFAMEQTAALYKFFFDQIEPVGNHRPVLTDPHLTPLSGDSADTYTFSVHYYDQDGDAPLVSGGQHYSRLYLSGGRVEEMSLVSGSAANGTYRATVSGLTAGNYQHFFSFIDSRGLDDVLGWLPGPYVSVAEGNDFTLTGTDWDDGTAQGDDDGVMEAGEHVRLKVRLRSDDGAQNVDAVLSTSDPLINITDPDVYYNHFSPGESQWSVGSFDMELNFILNPGQTRSSDFTVHVTYELSGQQYYQDRTFNKTFYRDGDISASFEVTGFTIDDSTSISYRNNADGVFQSGEKVRILPTIRNSGTSAASDINVELFYSGSDGPVEVRPGYERYPDLSTGQSAPPESGEFFTLVSQDWRFTGDLSVSMRVFWDENGAVPVEYVNAFTVPVDPAPIICIDDGIWSFGVVPPGTPVTHEVQVTNMGSGILHVSGITSSHADTSALPQIFTVSPGDSQPIQITFDTSSVLAGTSVSRTVTVVSDGRLAGNAPPTNTAQISGEVRDDAGLIYRIEAQPESYYVIDIGGTRIVWEDERNGAGDIYLFDIASGQERNLTPLPSYQEAPRISGDLVVWTDRRNGNKDVYCYDLSTDTEVAIANTAADEMLIGIDGDMVAFGRADFSYDSYGTVLPGYNVYLYNLTSGATTKISSYSAIAGSLLWSAEFSSDFCDFADGTVVWRSGRHTWLGGGNGWNTGYTPHVTKFAVGVDSAPVNLEEGFENGPATADGRVVWTETISGDDQIFLWSSGVEQQLTAGEHDFAGDALAIGGGIIVYDYWTLPGLYYWDIAEGQQHTLVDSPANCESVRIDGNGIVWLGFDPGPTIFVMLRNQADVAILPGDIAFSDPSPTEGDLIDVSVHVRNMTDYAQTDDITVRLYDGDPDAEGVPIAPDQKILGGLAGRGNTTVDFPGVVVPENATPDDPEAHSIFARISVPDYDNPDNNTAMKWLEVYDDDTVGPVISGILLAEENGDGDGVLGADEQIRISWSLSDPSDIAETTLWVDLDGEGDRDPEEVFVPVPEGGYYCIIGPLAAEGYDFTIDATDADNSPSSSRESDTFHVVPSEEITILFEGERIEDGETVPIDFGTCVLGGVPSSKIFIVRNDGEQALILGTLSVPAGFLGTGPASSVIQPDSTTHFTVTLDTSTEGVFSGNISLANSDGPWSPDAQDEDPFTFAVTGSVVAQQWTGSEDNHWENSANWLSGFSPEAAYTAVFDTGAPHQPGLYGAESIGGVDFLTPDWTIGGAGHTLTVGGGIDSAGSGTNTVDPNVALADDSAWTIGDENTLVLNGALGGGDHTLTKDGTGTLVLEGGQDHASGLSLTIDGGTVRLGDAQTLVLESLAIGSALDLTTGNLVLDYTTPPAGDYSDEFLAVEAWVTSGFKDGPGGYWDGPGIQSSAAAASGDHSTALAVFDNAGPGGGKTDLEGVPVDATSVFVKYAWYGDINLDGVVDFNDYNIIDNTFLSGLTTNQHWQRGDLNYDGVVDFNDYNVMDNTWLAHAGETLAAMQEPAAPALSMAPMPDYTLPPALALPETPLLAASNLDGGAGEPTAAAPLPALEASLDYSAQAPTPYTGGLLTVPEDDGGTSWQPWLPNYDGGTDGFGSGATQGLTDPLAVPALDVAL